MPRLLSSTLGITCFNRYTRRIIKTRGHYPKDWAATELVFLALLNVQRKREAHATGRKADLTEPDIPFGERLLRTE
ncbi:MAG: hypothetical protein OXN89_09920 [Bryobacterales bacterium]|nr:hypothetical protein [Bryobacterales bacterium]